MKQSTRILCIGIVLIALLAFIDGFLIIEVNDAFSNNWLYAFLINGLLILNTILASALLRIQYGRVREKE